MEFTITYGKIKMINRGSLKKGTNQLNSKLKVNNSWSHSFPLRNVSLMFNSCFF